MMTLCEAFETLYRPGRLATAAPKTAYQFELNIRRFEAFLDRDATLADLTDQNIAGAERWLRKGLSLSPGSIAIFRKNLLALWRYVARRGLVEEWPTLAKAKPPRRAPVAWTADELKRLFAHVATLEGTMAGVPAADWWRSLLLVLWDTGERVTAAMRTEWRDIDLAGGWIVVRAEHRKGGRRDHLSRLHPETVAALERVRASLPRRGKQKEVWPMPCDLQNIRRRLGKILEGAGLPNDRTRKFHCIRKSVASHLTAAGGDAMEALGHSSPWMTIDHYIDPRIARLPSAADLLPRIRRSIADFFSARRLGCAHKSLSGVTRSPGVPEKRRGCGADFDLMLC